MVVVHEASAVLEVQGRENRVISRLLSSHRQESTFPWDSAKDYFGQGRALSNRNVIQAPATKMILELLLADLSLCGRICETISGSFSAHQLQIVAVFILL